jgi:hypothetical protein
VAAANEISGAELAHIVDARHHNGYAADIYAAEPLVRTWAASVGLTALELAAIQPTYEFMRHKQFPPPQPQSQARHEVKDPATAPGLLPPSVEPIVSTPRAQAIRHAETLVFRCDSCGQNDLRPPNHFRCTVCVPTSTAA